MEKGFEAMHKESHNASFVFSFAAEAHMTTRNFCLWSVIYCLWQSSRVTVLQPVRSFWQQSFFTAYKSFSSFFFFPQLLTFLESYAYSTHSFLESLFATML